MAFILLFVSAGKANPANNCLDHWDDCIGHACDHGRCDDGEMSYVCQCYTGYTGDKGKNEGQDQNDNAMIEIYFFKHVKNENDVY